MSMVCTKFGGASNIALCELVADSVDELLSDAPTTKKKGTGNFADFDHYAPIGSTAIVGNEGGELLVFQLYSFGWKKIS